MHSEQLSKLLRILRKPRYWRALLHGVGASTEHEPLLRSLMFNTVVDVGANRGQFSTAVRACSPNATIIALEPLPGPARTFKRLFDDDPSTVFYQVAAGSRSGVATIHISGRDDSSSLLPITNLQEDLHPGTAEVAAVAVTVDRLDTLLQSTAIHSPALLKLDVQGYEFEALLGSAAILGRFSYVYVECSFVELYRGQVFADQVIGFLRESGFALKGIFNVCQDRARRVVQGDFFFARST